MRRSRKVVPITEAKRKPRTSIEVPVAVEGATRILTCHRTPAQISFSLGPPLAPGSAPTRSERSKGSLIVSASRDRLRERLRSTTPLARKELLKTNLVQQDRDARRYQLLRDYLLRSGIIYHVALSTEDSEPFAMGATFYGQTFEQAVDTLDPYSVYRFLTP